MMSASNLKQFFFVVLLGLSCLAPIKGQAESEGAVRYGVSAASLQNDFLEDNNDSNQSYNERGYRPVRLTGYLDSGNIRYFTRWIKNTDAIGWRGRVYLTLADFDFYNATYKTQDFYLVDVSGYQTPSGMRYAAIWYKNTNNLLWTSYRNLSINAMQQLHDTIGQNGWRPHRIEGYEMNGQSQFVSVWYFLPNANYNWHSKLTKNQYNDKFEAYKAKDFAPFHLDSHTVKGEIYYSGIWKQVNTAWRVRTNRAWNIFQRYYNNYWSDGYNIDNFYAAETPDGVRFGGIWFFDGVPEINENSSLSLRMRKEVDGAPARGGAAMINLTTNQETMLHADQRFAIASVIKIGILYALMREVDAGKISLDETINSGNTYGINQGNWLAANTDYTVLQMAQFMIRSSNNWATNRLIDKLGRNGLSGFQVINHHLADPGGLDLKVTQLSRYMLGGPSLYGNASAAEDHAKGIESISTPREMVTLLKRVINENLLVPLSKLIFWATLKMDGDNDFTNEKNYIPNVVTPAAYPGVTVFNKDGSLSDVRIVKSDAGAMAFPSGELVVYAVFMDEISDNPDVPGAATVATVNAAITALQNAGEEIAIEYD